MQPAPVASRIRSPTVRIMSGRPDRFGKGLRFLDALDVEGQIAVGGPVAVVRADNLPRVAPFQPHGLHGPSRTEALKLCQPLRGSARDLVFVNILAGAIA